jgi:pimeloyl-ACP methyl ester carboxylesterase
MATALSHGLNALTHMFSPVRVARRVRLADSVQLDRPLTDVHVPTLVVTGDDGLDSVVPVRLTEEYMRIWPHAERVTLARTGHIGLVTRPDAFSAAVGSFADRHAQRDSREKKVG